MSGLIAPVLDLAQRINAALGVLSGRLTEARAAAIDRLDYSVLDAAGPLAMPVTQLYGDASVFADQIGFLLDPSTLPRTLLPNTSGGWIPVCDVSGAGVLSFAGVGTTSNTDNDTAGLRITIDGQLVASKLGTLTAKRGGVLCGCARDPGAIALDRFPFRSGLLIEGLSSSSTNIYAYYAYSLTGTPS